MGHHAADVTVPAMGVIDLALDAVATPLEGHQALAELAVTALEGCRRLLHFFHSSALLADLLLELHVVPAVRTQERRALPGRQLQGALAVTKFGFGAGRQETGQGMIEQAAAGEHLDDAPLHVLLQGTSAPELAELVASAGGSITHDLHIINAVGARMSREQLDQVLLSDRVTRHMDDLGEDDDEEQEEETCRVRGHIELAIGTDGITWPYLEGGPPGGEVLLLVHGFGAEKDHWLAYARQFSKKYRVVIPDVPGFGEATKSADLDYGMAAQAKRMDGFLQALGISRCHAAGNSMGGYILLKLALDNPARLESLTLLNNAGVSGSAPGSMPSGPWITDSNNVRSSTLRASGPMT